jgi:adenine-specific DNA-methyltransferase
MTRHKQKAEPVARDSANIVADLTERLKEVFLEAVSEGKVDFERLRTVLGDAVDTRQERYSFTWAGKRDAIQMLQVPSRATMVPLPEESVNFEDTGHIFIEGENLEVLKLLYKSYFSRVKMIYIDPPYNTGNDFIYPDNFADPLDYYLKLAGQKDSEGNLLTTNPETSGRYQSAWLSMMYPRLFLARQLLSEEGIVFVSIDDHEVHNLRLLMNEVFGEENFMAQLVWKSRQFPDARAVTRVSTDHEYIVIYARHSATSLRDESKFSNPDTARVDCGSREAY